MLKSNIIALLFRALALGGKFLLMLYMELNGT